MDKARYQTAYLSMEIGLKDRVRSYAGGLGVLAGDILRSAADLGYPIVGMTLISDKGYFDQEIIDGRQVSFPESDYDFSGLRKLEERVLVKIGGSQVEICAWEHLIKGINGVVPVYFLDTSLEINSPSDRIITSFLYGGDTNYRLRQEIVLGIGGVKMLEKLGYRIRKYHLNEGHSSLAAAYLLSQEEMKEKRRAVERVKEKIVFTNHTPVKAGNDNFPLEEMSSELPDLAGVLSRFSDSAGRLDMTRLGMMLAGYISGVSRPHQKILRRLFPDFSIRRVNNGVDANYWASDHFAALFDEYVPGWRGDSRRLKRAVRIPIEEIWRVHLLAKQELLARVKESAGVDMDEDVFTIGFARRFAPYKRSAMIISDMEKLLSISSRYPLQIIYSGKAHPDDVNGQEIIAEILDKAEKYRDKIKIVFLEDYDLSLSRLMAAGCDLWLNNPLPHLEASGTSGMKAAINGVPQLSTADGWWVDGCHPGKTGWSFGRAKVSSESGIDPLYLESIHQDAPELYSRLEDEILPLFFSRPRRWQKVMQKTIAINGHNFNTQNTIRQYIKEAYS